MSDPYEESQDTQDARMCRYYYTEKGNVENYAEWPRIRERLLTERPEVVAAVDALKVAERTLKIMLIAWEDDDDHFP